MYKQSSRIVRQLRSLPALALAAAMALPLTVAAQPKPVDHSAHSTHPAATAPADTPLAAQIAELRAKVGKLEAQLQGKHQAAMTTAQPTGQMKPMPGMGQGATPGSMPGMAQGPAGGGMGMMGNMMMGMMGSGKPTGQVQGMPGGGMGMMAGEMGGMGSMPKGGGMPGMDQGMTSMMGMPPAGSMGSMAMPTALPGFPGASHLYHIGSTGFFLDHGEHITLTVEQQTALNATKEKALLEKANAQRKIDAAEQELWTLTAADLPNAEKIEAKVEEIEKARRDQRLNFIRSVGEAGKILTDEQRKSLLGQLPSQGQVTPATPAAPGAALPMGDM